MRTLLLSVAWLVMSGCAAQMVQKGAHDSCAHQGKKAFVFNTKQNGIPLFIDSASASYICVGPEDVTHIQALGIDAVSAAEIEGAGVTEVVPGSVAARAGLQVNDIVYEIAGRPIERARDLNVAADSMSPGAEVQLKLHRNGAKDTTVTAHF